MAIFTTEGVIIKRNNYGEADRILTVLTPFKGKIRIVAKGVRRITSRRGGNVELLNKVRLQVYQGKGMIVLSEAESLDTFQKLKEDLVLTSYASHIIELIDRLVPEEQMNPEVYNLVVAVLSILEKNPRQIFIRAFEVKLLTQMGFWSLSQIDATADIRKLLESLQMKGWGDINQIQISQEQALEVERILRYYIEGILESSLKSMEVIQKLKKNG